MKVRSNDWIVGLVIILAAIGIVASTMFLQQTSLVNKRLGVTARFRDVGNVQVGNEVVIRGVHAGRVQEIKLAEKGWVLVTMDLDREISLPPDPVVLIQSATLFGEWQAIITRRERVPANREILSQLADVTDAPPGALDGAVMPDIAQLTTVAGGIAGTDDLAATIAALRRTMLRADSATDSEQIQRIVGETERAMRSLREASERVNVLTLALQGTEANLHSVVVKADGILGKMDRGEGSLGMLLNDRGLYQHSDSLLIELRSLLADFRKSPKKYVNLSVF